MTFLQYRHSIKRRQALSWGAASVLAPLLITIPNELHAVTPTVDLPGEMRSTLPAARQVGSAVLRFF